MARSSKFAVIRVTPDNIRNETVNVGIIVFRDGEPPEIHIPELRKLSILTGHLWTDVADAFKRRLSEIGSSHKSVEEIAENISALTEDFCLGSPGIFSDEGSDSKIAIRRILDQYVVRPKLARGEKRSRINREISNVFSRAGILGRRGETLDNKQVIARYPISREAQVTADFAYMPDELKVVATLDLRGKAGNHGRACEKGAIFYFARKEFGEQTRPFGIFAVEPSNLERHRAEIEVLEGFADGRVFNWHDLADRQKFQMEFY